LACAARRDVRDIGAVVGFDEEDVEVVEVDAGIDGGVWFVDEVPEVERWDCGVPA